MFGVQVGAVMITGTFVVLAIVLLGLAFLAWRVRRSRTRMRAELSNVGDGIAGIHDATERRGR
jgi:hypothetical protein